MGISIDLFVTPQIDGEFLCPVCQDVLEDPVVIEPCEHAFCLACIKGWWKQSKTCPVDRSGIPNVGLQFKKPQRLYMNLLNNLKLICPFTSDGCKETVKLGDLNDHDQKCEHNPENHVPCEKNCGAILNQYIRKSGTHNCVLYLQNQLKKTQEQLAACQEELKRKDEYYAAGSSFQLPSTPFPAPETDNQPEKPKKRHIEPVDVRCVRKWNVSEEFIKELTELIQTGSIATKLTPLPLLSSFLDPLMDKIRDRARQLRPSHRPAFLNWRVTVHYPGKVSGNAAQSWESLNMSFYERHRTLPHEGFNTPAGLEFVVNERVLVKLLLVYY